MRQRSGNVASVEVDNEAVQIDQVEAVRSVFLARSPFFRQDFALIVPFLLSLMQAVVVLVVSAEAVAVEEIGAEVTEGEEEEEVEYDCYLSTLVLLINLSTAEVQRSGERLPFCQIDATADV